MGISRSASSRAKACSSSICGTVELGHHDRPVLEPDLVDAVLVAVEAQEPPVGTQAGGGDAVEHQIRRQARVGMRVHG